MVFCVLYCIYSVQIHIPVSHFAFCFKKIVKTVERKKLLLLLSIIFEGFHYKIQYLSSVRNILLLN